MDADYRDFAIGAFGSSRRAQMGAEVVRMMSDQPSRAIYGPEHDHQTLWQEYCHAHNDRETQSGLALWTALVEPYAEKIVAALPEPEVRLIAIAAEDDAPEGQAHIRERDRVIRYVLGEVAQAARATVLDAADSNAYTPTLWDVSPDSDDAEVLHTLMEAIRTMVRHTSWWGQDMIAAGETLEALERITDGEPIEVNVELTASFEAGDRDFRERRSVHLRVCEDCVSLDRSSSVYSPDTGGDRHSEPTVQLLPEGGFSKDAVATWLQELDAVLQDKRARLTVARDHI